MLKEYYVMGNTVVDFGEDKGTFRYQELETGKFYHKLPKGALCIGSISHDEAFEIMMSYEED